ncbi:MAG: hypothetical protein Fur0032_13740 [Terrimicrobiaceae bacterium]
MIAFAEALGGGMILADGDPGTVLSSPDGLPQEALCIRDPAAVEAAHLAFLDAGARIVRTLSRGANRAALARFGLADHAGEILWQAAQIARNAAKARKAWVAGSVGPLAGRPPQPKEILRQQIGALLDGGCDLISLEGFMEPDELVLALETKLELHHCPVICILDDQFPTDAIPRIIGEGADVVAWGSFNESLFEQVRVAGAAFGWFPAAAAFPWSPSFTMPPDLLGGGPGVDPSAIAAAQAVLNPE